MEDTECKDVSDDDSDSEFKPALKKRDISKKPNISKKPDISKKPESRDRVNCSLPRNVSNIPVLLAAADSCRLSNNDLTRILAPIVKEAGLSQDNVVLSINTVRRNRVEAREEGSKRVLEEMKELCQGEVVTLAWDEKQMYSEVIEVPGTKAEVRNKEMLAIVISCQQFPEGKTVAIVPMEEGREKGKDIAAKTWSKIEKAELNDLKFGGL